MAKNIPRMHINTTVSVELKRKADKYDIKFSEALRVGISVLLAEQGEDQFVNTVNVFRKIATLQELLQTTNEQLDLLKKR